jgi:hypothetical protein
MEDRAHFRPVRRDNNLLTRLTANKSPGVLGPVGLFLLQVLVGRGLLQPGFFTRSPSVLDRRVSL